MSTGLVEVSFSTFSNNSRDVELEENVTEQIAIGSSILADECLTSTGTISDGGYDVVAGSTRFGDTSKTSLIDVGAGAIGLGALASNGGPTQTVAISSTSDAHDFMSSEFCDATDQRGVARLQPGSSDCDVGAYQYVAAGGSLAYTVSGPPTPPPTPTLTVTPPPKPAVTLSGFSVNKRKGTATVRLSCARAQCTGQIAISVTLRKRVRLHGHEVNQKVVILLGTHRYDVAAGTSDEITIALDKTGRKDVTEASRKHPLSLSLSAATTGASIAALHPSVN